MKKNILYILLLFLLLTNSGCEKFIEVGNSDVLLPKSDVFKADATAISALTSIYSQMQGMSNPYIGELPYRISFWTGIAGDELKNFSTAYSDIAKNTLLSETSPTNALWNQSFSFIFQANAVYEGCDASNTLTSTVKSQLMGEARFIRAFWNFYLVNFYGQIPLVVNTNYSENAIKPRSSISEIYELIVSDLNYAKSHLNQNYVALNSSSPSTDRVRPNKTVASTLLAKVYLFNKRYDLAEQEANYVISNFSDYKLESIDKVFLTASKESIWQLSFPTPTNDRNSWEAYYYVLTGKPSSGINNSTSLSDALLSCFQKSDIRFVNWISKAIDKNVIPNVEYYYPSKYKVLSATSITERSTVFRLAEVLLTRAEARAHQNNIPGAIDDIDLIRDRAKIPLIKLVSQGISKSAVLDSIVGERQRELFTEWGNRWFDLKRLGKVDEVMTVVAPLKGSTWDGHQQLWPIPFVETQRNKNLIPNNPGYN